MRTKIAFLVFMCAAVLSCTVVQLTHNIPNFAQVEPGIWRGGQPQAQGWVYLKSIGVSNVVKLNEEAEGTDKGAIGLGMTVHAYPISLPDQIFHVDPVTVWDAVAKIKPGTYIHCQHGQDRTGLVVACWRLDRGMTREPAEKEMLAHGFHKELLGLWRFWKGE